MKLKLRAAAERDLDGIFDYSVGQFGADVATAYLRDLNAAMEHLLTYPDMGAETLLRPGLRRLSVREHRVFYRVEAQTVIVARVLHKAMDVERHL